VAPATQIIIQVKKYGGDVQNVGSMMFIAYSLCLITIPFWFAVWNLTK
jgi:predicted permease